MGVWITGTHRHCGERKDIIFMEHVSATHTANLAVQDMVGTGVKGVSNDAGHGPQPLMKISLSSCPKREERSSMNWPVSVLWGKTMLRRQLKGTWPNGAAL